MAMAPAPLPSLGLILQPGYALAADVGSFTYTGQDAALEQNLSVASSEYPAPLPSLGSLLGLVPNRVLTAGAGTFTIEVAPSLSDFAISAQVGEFAETGQDASLQYGRARLIAEAGAFAWTGQFATLLGPNEYRLVAESGTFAISGVDVPVKAARLLVADTVAYTSTGYDAAFARGLKLSADAGAYVATGWPATLNRTGGSVRYGRRGRRSAGTFPRRTNTVF